MESKEKAVKEFKRPLSGINPSSAKGLHLGNYFGAVKPHIEFQNKGECFYFVANVHSLNSIFSKKEVDHNTENVFIEYLAFGIDPDKTTFFVESDIPAIMYLQTILNNVVSVAELMRMHAYKDKMQKEVSQESINMGLFSYPMLMAADILAFRPDVVPVGEDQTQHVEICRDIAKAFNNRYGSVLTIPELFVKKDTAKVIGIDGERKMSKSLGNDIPVFADEKEVKKQIMKITTDPSRIHSNDPGDPAKNVAFSYLELLDFDASKLDLMKDKYKSGKIGDVEIKDALYDSFMDYFKEMRAKKQELLNNLDYIRQLRLDGAQKANRVADETLAKVKKAVGFEVKEPENFRKPKIGIDIISKLDIRVGKIITAERVEWSDKLMKLEIDFGAGGMRQILAGIAKFKTPEELINKQIPVFFNLEPRQMGDLVSQGMIMAADDKEGIVLMHPERAVESGSIVR
jgi:tryptophanyl-tRNA synthetase